MKNLSLTRLKSVSGHSKLNDFVDSWWGARPGKVIIVVSHEVLKETIIPDVTFEYFENLKKTCLKIRFTDRSGAIRK